MSCTLTITQTDVVTLFFSALFCSLNGVILYNMNSNYASSAVNREFEPRSDQTKDYKIGICCFSAEHMCSIKEKVPKLVDSVSG